MLCQLNISNRFKSKNFDNRKKRVSFIIFHYTETKDLEEAVKLLTDKKRKVSSHYVIDYNGSIYNLVDIEKRAWHAGESCWKNLTDINWKSYGVLAVLFMIVTSDVFQENVLSCFSSAMDGSIVTTTGMLITAIVLIIAHILIMYNI